MPPAINGVPSSISEASNPSSEAGCTALLKASPLIANVLWSQAAIASGVSTFPKAAPPELNTTVRLYWPGAILNSFS